MLGCILTASFIAYAETEISITEEIFPDSAFRKYVRDKIDTNNNGKLEETEQKMVVSVSVNWNDYNVSSFKGIERFTNLEELDISASYYPDDEARDPVSKGAVLTLDLSQNTKLKRLICSAGEIKGLNLSGLTALEEIRISGEHEQFDLSSNIRLRKVVLGNVRMAGRLPDLEELNVKNADMMDFDLSASKKLTCLQLDSVKMKKLWMSGVTGLKEIGCSSSEIPKIILDEMTSLVTINLDHSQVEKLSVGGCVNLKNLRCSYNQLKELQVQMCHKLTELNCSHNPIRKLKLSAKAKYNRLDVSHCALISLDLRKIKVKELECANNKLKLLRLKRGRTIEYISCQNNQLKSLDIRKCSSLRELSCEGNKLSRLRLKGCEKQITYLNCTRNKIRKLNPAGCTKLEKLYCGKNRLKELNVKGCKKLRYLHCDNNEIKKLDLRFCECLLEVYCNGNKIKKSGLRVSKSPGMKWGLKIRR